MTYKIDYSNGTIRIDYTNGVWAIIALEALKATRKHPLVKALPKSLIREILENES